MPSAELSPMVPLAATMDLQYRLPPYQQILYTPTIGISILLLLIGIGVVVYLSYRARAKAKIKNRLDSLKTVEKILLKRGGNQDDVERMLYTFRANPRLDPGAMVMIRDRFHLELRQVLDRSFGNDFGERMEKIYFPPPKESRMGIGKIAEPDLKTLVEERKTASVSQTAAAILDLMDAVLKPGVLLRLTFQGQPGGHECLVMGHDMHSIDITLPANQSELVDALVPGTGVEGTMECGTSLMAFTSEILQAVAGSMPYCRISAWKSVWEVCKRDSVRLPMSIEIDFQHIPTSSADSIKMSNLEKEIGSIRPGRLMDISLGGCRIETPSEAVFRLGDMFRFSKSLMPGNPPVTLLGALVNIDAIDPEENDNSRQRLHVQFLIVDDVSQRILVRTLRQLQDAVERDEWLQAQNLLQKMRRNHIPSIGSPASKSPRDSSKIVAGAGSRPDSSRAGAARPSTTRFESARTSMPRPGQLPTVRKLSSDTQMRTSRPARRPSTRITPKPTAQSGGTGTVRSSLLPPSLPLPPSPPPPPPRNE